jgi:hypothetical protein
MASDGLKIVKIKINGKVVTPQESEYGHPRKFTAEHIDEIENQLREMSLSQFKDYNRAKWTAKQWLEEYEIDELFRAISSYRYQQEIRRKLQKLRKRAKQIRDAIAEMLVDIPKGVGITTKDLILESPKIIRILVECGYSDIYHPNAIKFIHSQIRRIVDKDYKLYQGCEFIQSLPMPISSGTASYAGVAESTTVAEALVDLKRKKPTLTREWVNCTEEQLRKVIELDYKRRMGSIKSLASRSQRYGMPFNAEELLKKIIEREPPSEWRDKMIKLIEEEMRKNPHSVKQIQQKEEQEKEKWK